jgi:hypothetical protein
MFLVAFKEIPQRELRVLTIHLTHLHPSSHCCIQRNPTKGIERSIDHATGTEEDVSQNFVAFTEIPQRELRA